MKKGGPASGPTVRSTPRFKAVPSAFSKFAQTPDELPQSQRVNKEEFELVLGEVLALADKVQRRENKESRAIERAIEVMPGDYTTNVNRILFGIWARDYDAHMAGHVTAIEHLVRKTVALQTRGQRIFGKRILDVSSGTGSVIDLICRSVPPEIARQMLFIANDISPEMHEKAAMKLAELPEGMRPMLVPRHEDMRSLTVPCRSVDTAMISQTFHLITDPMMGPLNGSGNHNQVKAEVIESMFDTLCEGGHFILIDEWKPILTRRAGMEVIDTLFHATFKPVWEKYAFIEMMKRIRMKNASDTRVLGARLVAELKAWIDPDHRMYIFIYQKDQDKMYNRGNYLPDFRSKYEGIRQYAAEELVERFKLTDREFVSSFAPDNTPQKENLIKFGAFEDMKHTIVDAPMAEFEPGQEAIIFTRVLHDMPDAMRDMAIRNATESLVKGGVLLFIDEFHHPMRNGKSSKDYPLRKSTLRGDLGINYERDLLFEGALRVHLQEGFDSGMYGFMYRKIVD
jgi:SAM-dependent methyltransferase